MAAPAIPVKVFLADDSAQVRARIAAMLDGATVRVVGQAATPQAAIDAILASQPDVVVLDVQLIGGSGLDVLRAVRKLAPRIAFVVLSNHAGPAFRQRYLGEGAHCFLDKSLEFDQLAGAIAQTEQAAKTVHKAARFNSATGVHHDHRHA